MDYQLHSVYHPYSEVHHRNPIAPKPFPHGVSLGTAGISNTPRSVASRLLEMSDFPSKYERRAELDRMKSKRRLENNDFGLLPHNSLSTGLKQSTHYEPYNYTVPGNDYVTTRIVPVSRYPVRPIRMVALAPLSSRCIAMPDQSLDEFTLDVEADDARFQAGKEARRIQSALWQSAATDRVVRQCKERNRIRTQQKRIANARTLAPVFSSTTNGNLGPRQKVLISYHTGGGTSAAPERTPAKEPRKPKLAPAVNGTDEDDSVDFNKWLEKRKKARESIYEDSATNETESAVKQVEPETVTEVKSVPEPEPAFQPESTELQPESNENLPIQTEETQSTFSTNEQPDKLADEPPEEITVSLAPKSIKKSKYSKEEPSLKDKKDKKDRLFKKEKATPVAKEEAEPAPKIETVPQAQPIPEPHTEPEPEPIPEPVKQVEEEVREVESEVQAVENIESKQETQEQAEVVDTVSQSEEKPVETDTSRTTETFEETPTDVAEEVPESKADEPEFKISDEPHQEISEEVHVEEKSTAKDSLEVTEVVEEHSAEEQSSGVVELDESEKPKVEIEAAEEEKLVIEEIEEKEVSEAKPTIRKLQSVISYQEGDACDPVEWEEEESSTQHEEIVEEKVSRKIVLSASEEAIYLRYAAAESKEDKVPEEEDDCPGTTETAEDPSTTEEQTVKDVAHDLVDADPITGGNDDLGDISASTNEHAEAGSAATGDNAEETLSANGRPMSIDAESLVADDEQILDEALEATYCLHGQQLSEPHIEQPDEETEKYEDNEQSDSLIIEEDE